MAPTILAMLAVSLYPVARTLYMSLTNESLALPQSHFVGLANFRALADDALFWQAWRQTLQFTAASAALETVLGLGIALVLYVPFRGRGVARALVLVPWAIPTVVTSRMFSYIFDGQSGVVNYLLRETHLVSTNVNFLGSTKTALATIIIADVWKTTPFMAVLILAGLHAVPPSLLDAARLDGASALRTFWSVRMPLVAPLLLVAAMFRTLDALRIFDLPYVLTGGGPGSSTETLSTLSYKQLFSALQLGSGSSIATALFATEIVVATGFAVMLRRRFKKLEG